ncbi:MAG: hypothetical protein RQ868_02900 [Meiothermus sp.]|uniref:hypothetical protein n=1 Tax=Meiothermus sp. TaxID=1955249 RepID=UPI0028CF7318|nr:hypothetical protein [Meiothermus sp.]MDT7919522.1 hypothetical protein [Meiothermus sp.]
MDNIEQKVVEALSLVISPLAASSLLKRALGGRSPELLGPQGWAELIEGPLQQELRGILPMSGFLPELEKLARQLKAQRPQQAQAPAQPTLETTDPTEQINLQSAQEREKLVLELARGEGVLAVVLESSYGREYRLGAHNESLMELLTTMHRLLERKGSYRVFYTVLREAQLVLRPLGRGYLAVLTRNEANLGQLLYRMGKIEALQVGAEQ